ncbi:MAG: S-layer homology domain-containing protein [Oscillospiraceae bacterium]|jgi:hypothetical protein|nr:S-layer homology domain-containing protein [Oscillospiraceae bacterium]
MKTRKRILMPVVWLIIAAMLAGNFVALANQDLANEDATQLQNTGRPAAIENGTVLPEICGPGGRSSVSWLLTSSPPGVTLNGYSFTVDPAVNGIVSLVATVSNSGINAANQVTFASVPVKGTDAILVETAKTSLQTNLWNTIRGNNIGTQNEVMLDLNLPQSGANGTTISWSSNNPAVAGNGSVTRPAAGSPDASVTLTAEIVRNSAKDSISITVTVLANNDAADVTYVKGQLTWNIIRNSNDVQTNITGSLNLPTTGVFAGRNGVTITWVSSNNNVISTTGTVTRPVSGSDIPVTLTATITKGGSTDTVQFSLTVKVNDTQAQINAVRGWLTWDRIRGNNAAQTDVTTSGNTTSRRYNVGQNLSLPTTPQASISNIAIDNDVFINWSVSPNSNNLNVNTGVVTVPLTGSGIELTLTATITKASAGQPPTNNTVIFYLVLLPDQAAVDAVKDWLVWDRIRGSNEQQSSVTSSGNTSSRRYEIRSNLILKPTIPSPLSNVATDNVTITWTISGGSSSATVNPNTGVGTFPSSGNGQQVTMTATVRRNNATATKDFFLTLLPASTDQLAVNAAMNWVDWGRIRSGNPINNSATGPYETYANLTLPTSYTYSPTSNTSDNRTVTIRWEVTSSGTGNIITTSGTNIGRVTPPSNATASNPAEIKLTAVFTCGNVNITTTADNPNAKTFDLTVRQPSDAEAVRADRDAITWDSIKGRNTNEYAVWSSLLLPVTGDTGTTVTWSSSNTSLIQNNGAVNLPASGVATVTLTVVIRKGNASETKYFYLTVGNPAFEIEYTATGAIATLPMDAFNRTSNNGTRSIELQTTAGNVTFDAAAARAIGGRADTGGDVVVSINWLSASDLTYAQQTASAGRTVYELSVRVGNTTVTSFMGGTATVSIPYTLPWGEDANATVAYFLDSNGGKQPVRALYDTNTRRMVFATGHFSKFIIGYNPVKFTDDAAINAYQSGWAAGHIAFVGAREMFKGDQNRNYNPGSNITRGEFLAVLFNIEGANLNQYQSSRFTDLGNDTWNIPHIAWADVNGILGSYTSSTFRPREAITRADMAYWLYNFIQFKGIQLKQLSVITFSDTGGLSMDYRTATDSLASAGIISGYGEGAIREYRPNNTATRAEIASILRMFIERTLG